MNSNLLLTTVILLALSFLVGWLARRTAPKFSVNSSAPNIAKRGRFIRLFLGVLLTGAGIVLSEPLLILMGGFSLYEAAGKWCAFNTLRGKNECRIR